MLARIGFAIVQWKARHGLQDSRRPMTGKPVRRVKGCGAAHRRARGNVRLLVFAAPRVHFHRAQLCACPRQGRNRPDRLRWRDAAFVEVRTRVAVKGKAALPELSITKEKHEVLVRTAHYFLRERHLKECPVRFDVVAIDNIPARRHRAPAQGRPQPRHDPGPGGAKACGDRAHVSSDATLCDGLYIFPRQSRGTISSL